MAQDRSQIISCALASSLGCMAQDCSQVDANGLATALLSSECFCLPSTSEAPGICAMTFIRAVAPWCRFELVPLAEMGGRPRVDVLCNMSGIFRDSFQNVVELLDDLFQRAAAADEPPELNFIRCAAHVRTKRSALISISTDISALVPIRLGSALCCIHRRFRHPEKTASLQRATSGILVAVYTT